MIKGTASAPLDGQPWEVDKTPLIQHKPQEGTGADLQNTGDWASGSQAAKEFPAQVREDPLDLGYITGICESSQQPPSDER